MMEDDIYQASDGASNKIWCRQRMHGPVALGLRDKDGTEFVTLPWKPRLAALEEHAYWSQAHQRLSWLLRGRK